MKKNMGGIDDGESKSIMNIGTDISDRWLLL
jgi:hypothetical protein